MELTYKQIGFTGNSVTYSDPLSFADTAKASVNRKTKMAGPAQLTNVEANIKLNRKVPVQSPLIGDGCCVVPQYENLAMSFNSSGSIENIAALTQMKQDLYDLVDQWFDDVVHGFVPLNDAPVFTRP